MAKKIGSSEKEETTLTLNDIPGVGEATLKKLKEAGIISIRTLAMYPIHNLMEDFYYAGGFLLLSACSFLLDDEIRKVFLNNRNKTFDNDQ